MINWDGEDGLIGEIREYVLGQADMPDEAYSDAELKAWLIDAAHEALMYKKHLLIDADGNPRKSSEVVTTEGVDMPEKYKGALLHGALMFAFTEDQQRSSFERGLFMAGLGLGGR